MVVPDRELAQVETAKAYQIEDLLLLRVAGQAPTACHVVFLERSLLTVEPPSFLAGWYIRPDARCAMQTVPYEHHEVFRIGSRRDTVDLQAADGLRSVDVEHLTVEDTERGVAATRSSPIGDPRPEAAEAVGYSTNFDLEEAMRDAIGRLPSPVPPIPDWLSTYEVVSIRAEIGGIAGFNHLAVRVRGG